MSQKPLELYKQLTIVLIVGTLVIGSIQTIIQKLTSTISQHIIHNIVNPYFFLVSFIIAFGLKYLWSYAKYYDSLPYTSGKELDHDTEHTVLFLTIVIVFLFVLYIISN